MMETLKACAQQATYSGSQGHELGDHASSRLNIAYGVRQGSVFSLKLFISDTDDSWQQL